MKILLVTSDLSDGGGVNRVIANLTYMFQCLEGVEVHVLHVKPYRGSTYPLSPEARLVPAHQWFAAISPLNLLLNLVAVRSRGYDYVLSFWAHENLCAAVALLGSRTRLILSEHFCHDQFPGWIRLMRRWIYPTAHKLLLLNSSEMDYYGRFARNVELVPNPVLSASGNSEHAPAKENLILGVGHLIKRKGFAYFIEACVAAKIREAGWQAVIVGNGSEGEELQRLILHHGAADYIRLVPATQAIDDWYRRARIVMIPSISEVFSMVLPEAMSHGAVPLAFAADGPREILRGYPEHVVPIGDVPALAAALQRTIHDPAIDCKAGRFRDDAFSRYSFSAIAARWQRLLYATT
ncbi:glycosyltransferase [Ramlibacter sp. AN1133]|uniref:glycosyltransferase n=1 Tax=Ramlibacter sp. AN1133 TaxID=3133429 RepID=UPI0030BB5AFA